jgi:predicted MPP superfamily phosphohydrolase
VPVAGLAPELAGFRVVQLSDFHAGSLLGRKSLVHAVELANAERADLAVLTGDYITHHWSEALLLLDELAALRARLGVFAVFGNHDYRGREEPRIAAAFLERGIRFLRNEGVRFGEGRAAVALVGVEDLEEARFVDLAAARAAVRPGDVEIVLCHNPRRAAALAHPGVAAILCGHTHGTQIDLPFLRRLGPAHPGARVEIGATRVITSRGLGVVGVPLRVGAPAELVVVQLAAAEGGRACSAA